MLPLYFSSFLHLWMVSICFNQVFFCLRLCCWAAGRSMFVPRYEGAADTANNLWTGLSGVFQEVASRGFFFGVPLRSNGYRAYHSHRIHGAAIYMVTLIFTINIPPNVSIYTIHGSYGYIIIIMFPSKLPFWTILIHFDPFEKVCFLFRPSPACYGNASACPTVHVAGFSSSCHRTRSAMRSPAAIDRWWQPWR